MDKADIDRLKQYEQTASEYGLTVETMLELAKSQIKTAKENIQLRELLGLAVEDIDYLQANNYDRRCKVCKEYDNHSSKCTGRMCDGVDEMFEFEWQHAYKLKELGID